MRTGRRIIRIRTANADRNDQGCPNFHCKLGPCRCDTVVRLNGPRNFVPLAEDHNLGLIGKQLTSPAFRNSPSVEEYCETIQRYIQGNKHPKGRITKEQLQNMFGRISRLS